MYASVCTFVCIFIGVCMSMLACVHIKVRTQSWALFLRTLSIFFESRALTGLELADPARCSV